MTSSVVLERARAAKGQGILYRLGKGGYDPKAALPGARMVELVPPRIIRGLDCSGFVAWCCGISRDPRRNKKNPALSGMPIATWPRWVESTNIWADVTGEQIAWINVPFDQLQPGDVLVYPDFKNALGQHREGHVAIVADPVRRTIVDCSSSQSKALGQAITERDGSFFWRKIAARGARLRGA